MNSELFNVQIQYYVVCWMGAVVLYFRLKNENRATWKFLCFINNSWIDSPKVNMFEILLFTIIGSFVGTVLTQPSTHPQAFAAGLGWMGLLGTTGSRTNVKTSHLEEVKYNAESIK